MHANPPNGRVEPPAGQVWRFAGCEFDELRRELRVRGAVVEVESKPLDVLRQLLVHAGEVVTKDELLESVWPGLLVVDGSLATAISKLRKALGGDESPILNVPRVGYRLAVPVHISTIVSPTWAELDLTAGEPVPGRDSWRLARRLDLSPSSEVWLAEHSKTHESRVFKFAPDADGLKCLKREVTLARLLRESFGPRPDFVRVLEWNFTSQPYFIESEYSGASLAEWAAIHGGLGSIALELRLRLVADIARAVSAAHSVDVLHKDLKPGNILVSDDPEGVPQIKIADFGSASLLAPARLSALGITNLGFTRTSESAGRSWTGTVMYVAPEVLAGQSPTIASDVYALGVLLYQMVVGDFRKALAPGWEAEVADPLLREDIAAAACGDPSRRFNSAAELLDRLLALGLRREDSERRGRAEQRALVAERRQEEARVRRPWLVLTGAALLVAIVLGLSVYSRSSAPAPRIRTVAVLPFLNVGSDTTLDFLRLALPDEVTTLLSHTRALTVRPFATTSQYDRVNLDLQRVGRDMRVDGIVTGHFLQVGDLLQITVEGLDVHTNRLLWRDTLNAPIRSLIAIETQIALRVRGGLAPALGSVAPDEGARPMNEEAYALFLRSAAVLLDAVPNRDGIAMLEKSVELDPTYAPAWHALARRYYVQARYETGTPGMIDRYDAALGRAAALDPSYVAAVAGLILSQTERGHLVTAFTKAEALVSRRPDSADTHFALSYVLRFAGLLDDAARHCETAFLLEPQTQTSGLWSCAVVFLSRGDYPRAMDYLDLDSGSDYAKALAIHILVRQGKEREASAIRAPHIPQWSSYDLLLACLEHKPANQILALSEAVRPSDDPEVNYFAAAHLAYCGETAAALEMLTRAITQNYCSYPAIETDPFFARARVKPEFASVRAAAMACQNGFLAERTQVRQSER